MCLTQLSLTVLCKMATDNSYWGSHCKDRWIVNIIVHVKHAAQCLELVFSEKAPCWPHQLQHLAPLRFPIGLFIITRHFLKACSFPTKDSLWGWGGSWGGSHFQGHSSLGVWGFCKPGLQGVESIFFFSSLSKWPRSFKCLLCHRGETFI